MWLCKRVSDHKDSISIKNECRFGINCVFAHSKEEVLQMVEHCKNGETCKNVSLIFKQDENGKRLEDMKWFKTRNALGFILKKE